jgi:hypothetical protein
MFHDIELAVALENFEPSETVDERYRFVMSLHPILSKAYIYIEGRIEEVDSLLPEEYRYIEIKTLTYNNFMHLFHLIRNYIDYNAPLGEFEKFKWDGV